MAEQNKTVSEFNEMGRHIDRLDIIWRSCRQKKNSGNLSGWKWDLDSAEIELEWDAKKLDKEKDSNCYIQTLKDLNSNILGAEQKKSFEDWYKHLKEKEMLLREVQQQSGKGSRYRDEWDEGL